MRLPRLTMRAMGNSRYSNTPPSDLPVGEQLQYILGNRSDRESALAVGALFRSVTLISSIVAEVISRTVQVVDLDDRKVQNQPPHLIEMLRRSPDGETAAYQFLEDLCMDLLLEGNALVVVERGPSSRPFRLRRMAADTAFCEKRKGRLLYYGELAGTHPGDVNQEWHDSRNVVHARWADLTGRETLRGSGDRAGFVSSPLKPLAHDLRVSREIVAWIAKYYDTKGGSIKSDKAIIYPELIQDEQEQKNIVQAAREYTQSGRTMILFGNPKIENLKATPQDAETAALRIQEIQNIGMAFGIPAPLLGINVTQWGSGIAELTRLFWKFSGRQVMNRLLQPMSLKLLPAGREFGISELSLLRGDNEAVTALINATRGTKAAQEIVTRDETRRHLIGLNSDYPADADGGQSVDDDMDAPPPEPAAEPEPEPAGGATGKPPRPKQLGYPAPPPLHPPPGD